MKISMKSVKYIIFGIISLLLVSCTSDMQDANKVVARAGNRKFREAEIAFAYELAPRQLTKLGKEKALTILVEKMINRKLLADEAKRKGLNDDSLVQRWIEYYENAEICRQLFLKHIRDSVLISEEELKIAYQKDKQGLLVKHYVTDNFKRAKELYRQNNLPEHIPLLNGTRIKKTDPYGMVDSIEWNILDKRIENILYNLPLARTSRPIQLDAQYHLFKVMDKDVNVFTTNSEYLARRPSLKSVLRKRKEHAKAFQFVQRIMKPQNLTFKGDILNQLSEYLYSHYQNSDKPNIKIKNSEINLNELQASGLFDSRLADYRSGSFKVSDFFFYNRVNPQSLNIKSQAYIRHDLADIIATYVRDRVFSEMGKREGLHKLPEVELERKKWEEKILANHLKRKLYNDSQEKWDDPQRTPGYYRTRLEKMLKDLRSDTRISINKKRLYRIKTSDEGLPRKIDFFAKNL